MIVSNISRRVGAIAANSGSKVKTNFAPWSVCDLVSRVSLCSFSNKSGGGGGSDNSDDPFGLNFEDSPGDGNIGPKDSLPPNYIRDSATGKFTGEIQVDASDDDKKLLNLGPIGKEQLLRQKFEQSISSKADGVVNIPESKNGENHSIANIARRIREEKGAFNTLGRKVSDLEKAMENGDDKHTASLAEDELASLYKFVDHVDTSSEDTSENTKKVFKEAEELNILPEMSPEAEAKRKIDDDNPDLDLSWMHFASQRKLADEDKDDMEDPFSHLMPSDFNPATKVNRRRAKPVPKELLHHNNLSLLRRYVTPGGQIMNRAQTRLGAKDQRKVAKLIKRARALGIIPVIGQWKIEDHGNIRDPSLMEDKEWEKRLIERGLVTRKSTLW
uniref:Ribosomal protein S18 n=1 Tax=Chaetoceros debilis TaxID=122233 RepID=A0A7S3PVQ7_9STRA